MVEHKKDDHILAYDLNTGRLRAKVIGPIRSYRDAQAQPTKGEPVESYVTLWKLLDHARDAQV